jgi:hypothetical protein
MLHGAPATRLSGGSRPVPQEKACFVNLVDGGGGVKHKRNQHHQSPTEAIGNTGMKKFLKVRLERLWGCPYHWHSPDLSANETTHGATLLTHLLHFNLIHIGGNP